MSDSDIEDLLAAASDDADQPLHHSVDEILQRGRRSLRHRRIASAATAVLTTAAIAGGVSAWSANRPQRLDPAGTTPSATVVVDPGTGKVALPPPPVSPLSDHEILQRCDPRKKLDDGGKPDEKMLAARVRELRAGHKATDLEPGWTVELKTGTDQMFSAILVSADRTLGIECGADFDPAVKSGAGSVPATAYRIDELVDSISKNRILPWMQAPREATRVLVDVPGESVPRAALIGTDGFYTLGAQYMTTVEYPLYARVRAYDASGKKVMDAKRTYVGFPTR